ncbi:MAG: DNA mismatch endonuclease Vsr [Rickettsiaceae bacterium H1]|nr:DNA mismatch endonuclease Vsr [Rickettsiaceae bacterium H1]
MDIFTKEKRSKIMSEIRSKDTKPEIMLRKALFNKGYRYRTHAKNIDGKPDIYLKKYNAVIFFHGCFWHGHNCKLGKLPKTRIEFWKNKIESNKKRDSNIANALKSKGYRVLIVWGCVFQGKGQNRLGEVIDRVTEWINSKNSSNEILSKSFE